MGLRRTDRAVDERLPAWGVVMIESHHADDFVMEWRRHSFVKLIYALSGSGEVQTKDQSIEFSAGDCVVVPSGIENRIVDTPKSQPSLYVCCIEAERFDFDPSVISGLAANKITGGGATERSIASLMRRLILTQNHAQPDCSISMVADGLSLVRLAMTSIGRKVSQTSHEADQKRQRIIKYVADLEHRFYEVASIDQAASELDMSRRSFTDLFAAITGTTWLRYRRRLAIEHAKKRLIGTDLSIVSIAFECGYEDLSTFYRQFKQECGTSPAIFRKEFVVESLSD